jgi:NAD(P)-dependent dehydrogenase (short-subunit alcohol dehydrogenase family)
MGVALVTGANKGIGLETARQLVELGHVVYLGARDRARGDAAASAVGARFVQLDVTDDGSVARAVDRIAAAETRLDILVNNAGIQEFDPVDGPLALRAFDTNAVGVVRVTEAALPLLRASAAATVVTVNAIEPGYTATDMTAGFDGGRPVRESARAVVELATIGADGPTGTFRDESGELSW